MRSFTIASLLAAGLASASNVPAIQRKISELGPAYSSPKSMFKRQSNGDYCVDGTVAGWQCCNDGWYCEPSEFCVTETDNPWNYCCPSGSTYDDGLEECVLTDGDGNSLPQTDTLPDITATESDYYYPTTTDADLSFPTTPVSYYESVATISYTAWYPVYDEVLSTDTITSEPTYTITTMTINTNDETDASSYFSSKTSYLSSVFSSYYAAETNWDASPATVITLGQASNTGSVTTTAGGFAPTAAGSSAPGAVTSAATTTATTHATGSAKTSSGLQTTASASGEASSSAATASSSTGAAASVCAPGFEAIVASVMMVFALSSGVSAVLL